MNRLEKLRSLICFCFLLLAGFAYGQQDAVTKVRLLDKRVKIDTLERIDRLSIRTNALDWALQIPNVGVEYDLVDRNYGRWAIAVNVRANWPTSHTYKHGFVYNLAGISVELRNYWRPRQIGRGVPPHEEFFDRLVSCRREVIKRPLIVYHRGGYLSFNSFSFKTGPEGRQGSAVTIGASWGATKPLYVFNDGRSLDLEFGIKAGVAIANYDTYCLERESNCYPVTSSGNIGVFPVISELRFGFVYRLGTYPSTSRYRWRYDVDPEYTAIVDSITLARNTARRNKMNADSITKIIDKEFIRIYNEAAIANQKAADEQERLDALKAKEEAARKKEETVVDPKEGKKTSEEGDAKPTDEKEVNATEDKDAKVALTKEEKAAAKKRAKAAAKAAKDTAKAAKKREKEEKKRKEQEEKSTKEKSSDEDKDTGKEGENDAD